MAYDDRAEAVMPAGVSPVRITEIGLRPHIRVRDTDPGTVARLVVRAHDSCYIAHSLTAKVRVEPAVEVA